MTSELAAPVHTPLPSSRRARMTGAASGIATLLWLLLGAHRAYDLDDSITVGLFVATDSIGDAFTKAYVLNNHPLLSFLEHAVYSVTGSRSELTMRMLPICAAAAAVGLLANLVADCRGALAGAASAAVLATNPMFADVGSQVRGYSIVVLCAIATTAILLRALRTGRATALMLAGYGAIGAIGVATHLYMLVVLGIHAIISLVDPRVTRRWLVSWLGAVAFGAAAYVRLWRPMRDTADSLGRNFRPVFPRDLGVALLGGTVIAAALTAPLVVPVLWQARHSRVVRLGALGVILAAVGIWLVAPFDLYPRFFLWLVPLPAVAVGVAVARRPFALALVAAIVIVQVVTVWPRLTEDPFASHTVAAVFTRVRAKGGLPCTIDDFGTLRLLGYRRDFGVAASREQMRHCTVAVLLAPAPASGPARNADAVFRYRGALPARAKGVLWSVVPIGCWFSDHPSSATCRVPTP